MSARESALNLPTASTALRVDQLRPCSPSVQHCCGPALEPNLGRAAAVRERNAVWLIGSLAHIQQIRATVAVEVADVKGVVLFAELGGAVRCSTHDQQPQGTHDTAIGSHKVLLRT